MCLLSKNKIADFHTELEQLPSDALQNNPYIRCPVRMEQFIMEGSYNKVGWDCKDEQNILLTSLYTHTYYT